ncbi:GNAT domain-containing protein [Podospora australis]|uniref:GNAT domain-containing protein n=1 Tax=Podospora australis TaxID=1536484 RepID=A0AAN6X4Z3_9PEZI|nr:GNAT domain-containing protein [Podospora australis]
MKLNEHAAVSTTSALLVPYDHHHVLTYHAWMQDPAIQEATASEPLTLEEEYENQESWRLSHDKLTFIICQPPLSSSVVSSGEADTPERMIGDVNLFLYPHEEEDEEPTAQPKFCVGEVDIMIADPAQRGKGLGRAVVGAFLAYIEKHEQEIMEEYASDKDISPAPGLKMLMAKISEGNTKSIALFESLGFEKEGEVNYFGELKLVLRDLKGFVEKRTPEGYKELVYSRESSSRLGA